MLEYNGDVINAFKYPEFRSKEVAIHKVAQNKKDIDSFIRNDIKRVLQENILDPINQKLIDQQYPGTLKFETFYNGVGNESDDADYANYSSNGTGILYHPDVIYVDKHTPLRRTKSTKSTNVNRKDYEFRCTLSYEGVKSKPFIMMRFPWMDNDGIIHTYDPNHRKWNKMFINDIIESSTAITLSYDNNGRVTFKFSLPKCYLSFSQNLTCKVSTHKSKRGGSVQNLNIIDLLSAFSANPMGLKSDEEYEPEVYEKNEKLMDFCQNLFREYAPILDKKFKDDDALESVIFSGRESAKVNIEEYNSRVLPKLLGTGGTDLYNVSSLRDDINNFLSIDRVKGRVLAQRININGSEYTPGYIIDDVFIDNVKKARVNSIKVFKNYQEQDLYLGEQMPRLFVIKHGTPIDDFLLPLLPDEYKGMMYVPVDIDLSNIAFTQRFIDAGAPLSESLRKVLIDNGVYSIGVKDNTGKDRGIFELYETVIGNNSFNEGSEQNPKWAYGDALDHSHLTVYDLISIWSIIKEVENGDKLNIEFGNVDLTFSKKFVSAVETYEKCITMGCNDWMSNYSTHLISMLKGLRSNEGIKDRWMNNEELESKFRGITESFRGYLLDRKAKHYITLTADNCNNPLHTIAALSTVNVGASMREASPQMIAIPMGSFGKIDTCEVPQSKKLGLVMHKTLLCKTKDGIPASPYRRLIQKGDSFYIGDEDEYLTAGEEVKYNISDISFFRINGNRILGVTGADRFLCRVKKVEGGEVQSIASVPLSDIHYISVYPETEQSWSSQSVPFLGANDGMRAIFGVSQAKAAKAIIKPEKPLVMTPCNRNVPRSLSMYNLIAEGDGIIKEVSWQTFYDDESQTHAFGLDRDLGVFTIKVWYSDNLDKNLPYEGQVKAGTADESENTRIYTYESVVSNGISVATLRPCVCPNQHVKKGDVLVTSNFLEDGYMAIGTNAFVAYIPDGFNYEDGAHISETFSEKMQSVKIHSDEMSISAGTVEPKINKNKLGVFAKAGSSVGTYVDVKGRSGSKSKNIRLNGHDGFLSDVTAIPTKVGMWTQYNTLMVKTVTIDNLQIGDKIANRHGNKGVISRIEDDDKMYCTINGKTFDIIYNPMGVISRKNIGQILEAHLSLVGHLFGIPFVTESMNGISTEEVRQLLHICWTLANTNEVTSAGAAATKWGNLGLGINFWNYIFNERIEYIKSWRGVFNQEGEAYVVNPKTGRLTETPCIIGFQYVYKLVQESEKKAGNRGGMLNARTSYSEAGDAPTQGGSRGGGQRAGFMELDGLACYNVNGYINHIHNEKCDNAMARSRLYTDIIDEGIARAEYNKPGRRRSVSKFLYMLLAMGIYPSCDNGEFENLETSNEDIEGITRYGLNEKWKIGYHNQDAEYDDYVRSIQDDMYSDDNEDEGDE